MRGKLSFSTFGPGERGPLGYDSKELVREFTAAWRRGDTRGCTQVETVAELEGLDGALTTIAEVKQTIPLGPSPDEPAHQASDSG
jgi:hypothetical protein